MYVSRQIFGRRVSQRRECLDCLFDIDRGCWPITDLCERCIGFGEQAIIGEGGNQIAASIIAKHGTINRKIAAEIDGAARLRLGTCEPVKDDLALLARKM